jgi:hypothetical protein
VCELVEDHGPEEAARLIAATLPDAPPIWRAADGTLVIARTLPAGHGLELVEDWGAESAGATWLDRVRERNGQPDPDADRQAETNFRRSLDAEKRAKRR